MRRVILVVLVSAMFGLLSLAACNKSEKTEKPCDKCTAPATVAPAK